ncbi:hypothetical protein CGCVW01_v013859, partial [Colletotrichum viniferum]
MKATQNASRILSRDLIVLSWRPINLQPILVRIPGESMKADTKAFLTQNTTPMSTIRIHGTFYHTLLRWRIASIVVCRQTTARRASEEIAQICFRKLRYHLQVPQQPQFGHLTPKISDKQDPKPDGDLLLSWNATFLAWWQELIWCAISLMSVSALYILLRHYDNRKLPDWPSGLTLNTVIALLATVARSAFVIPVSEGLSQLKWLWYRKQRTLKDFQDFDAASCGPWGSLQLVKTTKGWRVAAERHIHGYIKGPTYDASIQAGLSHDSNTLYPFDQPGCPTTECRWRVFSTLAICTKMWNMTDQLTYNYNGNSSRFVNTGTPRSLSLPNGALANFAPSLTGLVSLNNGQASLLPAAEVPQPAFFNFTVIFTTTKTTGAMEVMFYMCAQRYNVSVQNNVFSRTLIHSSAEVEEGTFLMPESTTSKEQVEVTTEAVTVPQEPGVAFLYGGTALTPLIESLSSAMNGTYPTTENERGRAPSRYLNVLDVVRRERNGTEKQLFEAVGNVTNNVARSLTNSLRDSLTTEQAYITGQAYVSE